MIVCATARVQRLASDHDPSPRRTRQNIAQYLSSADAFGSSGDQRCLRKLLHSSRQQQPPRDRSLSLEEREAASPFFTRAAAAISANSSTAAERAGDVAMIYTSLVANR